jgi:hypothetical protein
VKSDAKWWMGVEWPELCGDSWVGLPARELERDVGFERFEWRAGRKWSKRVILVFDSGEED